MLQLPGYFGRVLRIWRISHETDFGVKTQCWSCGTVSDLLGITRDLKIHIVMDEFFELLLTDALAASFL
jgi:hypothetical protein